MPIVTPMLAGDEFVFFGLSLIIILRHLRFLLFPRERVQR
jgi:hypothetical protein